MKKTMSKEEIIKKIVDIDAELFRSREVDHHLNAEQYARLRSRRDALERKLYK